MSSRIRCISKWAVALGLGTVLVAAPTASAHVDAIVASCEAGVVINLTDYNDGGINTISVSIDGSVALSTSFGAGISTTVPFGDPFATHSYRVVVRAWDDPDSVIGWSFDTGVRGIPVCAELPVTSAPVTTAAPATTAVAPVTTTTLVAGGSVSSSTVAPTPTTAPTTTPATTPTPTAPTAVPPSTAGVVAQAPGGPTTVPAAVPPVPAPTTAPPTTVIVASEAPPVVGAELPATGDVNFVVVALGLIVGGMGLLTTALLRRSPQS